MRDCKLFLFSEIRQSFLRVESWSGASFKSKGGLDVVQRSSAGCHWVTLFRENRWKTLPIKFHRLRVYDVVREADPELYLALRSVAPHHKDFILLNRFASSRIMLVCAVCCVPCCECYFLLLLIWLFLIEVVETVSFVMLLNWLFFWLCRVYEAFIGKLSVWFSFLVLFGNVSALLFECVS